MAVGSEQKQCLEWGKLPAASNGNQGRSHQPGAVGSSWDEHPHLWDSQEPPLSLCWEQTEQEGPGLSFGSKVLWISGHCVCWGMDRCHLG